MPPVDRFNPGQKYFYWVMLVGAILLLLSGVALWFPDACLRACGRARRGHLMKSAALVTIGAFIIHVYMGLFMVPRRIHGRLSAVKSRRSGPHAPPALVQPRRDQRMSASTWDRRIARAEKLAVVNAAAAELLKFYAQITRFQKSIYDGDRTGDPSRTNAARSSLRATAVAGPAHRSAGARESRR